MEQATIELRNAIQLASSLEPNNNHDRSNDELLNNDVQVAGGSSEGTYISSLSGSIPSDRSTALASRRKNYYAANNMMGGAADNEDTMSRHAWQRRRLHVATRVENAVSNYELAVYTFHSENMPEEERRDFTTTNDDGTNEHHNGDDIVDLLVAVLTSVPSNLFQQAELLGGEKVHTIHPQQEEEFLASMEQICFNAACISSDVLRKYFQSAAATINMEHPPMLEDRHVYELMEEVVHICNTDPSIRAWSNIDPIVRILNSLSEGRQMERSMYEREQGNVKENGYQTLFSCLPSKESLRLVHTLMYRYLCEQEDESVEASSSLVGHFISYLLEHFATVVVIDMGYDSLEVHSTALFDAWAEGVDEHMVQRLNDEEARDVHALVVRYHIGSIQTAFQLMDDAESVISTTIAESETNDGIIDDNILESVLMALQETIRHMTMVVTTTEVMDKLSLEHDPEIHVLFFPLIVSYARFIVSFLHNAIGFLRRTCGSSTLEGEEMSILADDLLFRICRVTLGRDFLRGSNADNTGEEEEVICVALLRAMNSQCITGKARFLLGIAADRVRSTDEGSIADNEPVPKRQRIRSTFGCGQLSPPNTMYKSDGLSLAEERRGEMMDVLLACLALSRSNQDDEHPDGMSVKQTSCITSALMFRQEKASGDGKEQQAVLDPLNPWHTLQVKSVQRLADFDRSSNGDDNEGTTPSDSLLLYALSTPHLLDTKPSLLSL